MRCNHVARFEPCVDGAEFPPRRYDHRGFFGRLARPVPLNLKLLRIDEIVGMWISLLFLPKTFFVILLAFIFFRLFDILKPPPARQLEPLPNGWGIMLDDVMAGIYANLAVRLVLLVFPTVF